MDSIPTESTSEVFRKCKVTKCKTSDFPIYERLRKPLPNNPYLLDKALSWALSEIRTFIVYHRAERTQVLIGSVKGPITDGSAMFIRIKSDLDNQLQEFRNMRTNRLLEKIGRVSIPLITMYKERRETEKLLVSFVNKALYAVRNLRHPKRILWHYGVYDPQKHTGSFLRKLKKKTMSAETAGDAWLQYRFAWKPLIHDIQQSVVAAMEQEKKLNTFRVSTRKDFDFHSTLNYYSSVLEGQEIWSGRREGGINAGISYSFSDITLATLSSFTSLPASVWDLTPWSFVIDRFVDISSLLDLYDATSGATFEDGYLTTFYTQSVRAPSSSVMYYPDIVSRYFDISGRTYYMTRSRVPPREDVYMKREVLTQFPTPQLEYPMSFFIEHGIDYAALLRQLAARFRKKP